MYFYFLIKRSSNTWKWLHLKFCPSESLQFDTLLLFESETLRVSSYLQKQEHHRCPYYHTVDRLYHPLDISSSRLYWPFSAGTEFFHYKTSGYIIQPFGYISHFESCERELSSPCFLRFAPNHWIWHRFHISYSSKAIRTFSCGSASSFVFAPPFAAQPHRNICALREALFI